MNIDFIDINLLLRLCILIVTIGIGLKIIKLVSSLIFKIASITIMLILIFNIIN